MSIEGFPLAPVSNTGTKYLGMDARPDFIPNLVEDATYAKAVASTVKSTRSGEVVAIPVRESDLRDTMTGIDPRRVAPVQTAESRTPFLGTDVKRAAKNYHIFGMGQIDSFRSDKPQTGLNFLRKEVKVPADLSVSWNVPTNGPYNPFSTATAGATTLRAPALR